jgi:predicted dinucleotide-binding enzyme
MDDAIGIIGAGRLGQALARTARRANRPVVIANSRGPESLQPVVDVDAGPRNRERVPGLEPVPLGGQTSSEIVAQLVPGARVVKTANTLAADVLGADPRVTGGRRVLFVSGDDAEAKRAVGELFDAAGFFPIDIGGLVTGGGMQQAGGPLAGHNLVRMPAPWE